jgi:hypothetical protein
MMQRAYLATSQTPLDISEELPYPVKRTPKDSCSSAGDGIVTLVDIAGREGLTSLRAL